MNARRPSSEIMCLPNEPPIGAIVEIVDGANRGNCYRRTGADDRGWVRIYPDPPITEWWVSWSEIWWAVTEDSSGGTSVRVTVPDPGDPHPLPWTAVRERVWDANGELVPAGVVVAKVNGDG